MQRLHEAAAYLSMLSGKNGWIEPQVFITRDERRKNRSLTRMIQGSLSEKADELIALNDAGAEIHVIVNKTDGKGWRAKNVTAIQAVFVDSVVGGMWRWCILPTMQVKVGCWEDWYWRVWNVSLEDFNDAQVALSRFYETHGNPRHINAEMLLPGFVHRGYMTEVVSLKYFNREKVYGLSEIIGAHSSINTKGSVLYGEDIAENTVGTFESWVSAKTPIAGREESTALGIAREGFRRGFSEEDVECITRVWCEWAGVKDISEETVAISRQYVNRKFARNRKMH